MGKLLFLEQNQYILVGRKIKIRPSNPLKTMPCHLCQQSFTFIRNHLKRVHNLGKEDIKSLKFSRPNVTLTSFSTPSYGDNKFFLDLEQDYLSHR